jgi:cell division septum initiation protein DivIVA
MTTNTIPFAKKAMGYDPEQVDKYFQKVAGEYSCLQRSYTELFGKYEELTRQSNDNMTAIAKAMVDAEVQAIRTVSDAKAEAAKIINGAYQDLTVIQNEKARLTAEITNIIERLKSLGYANIPYGT